MNSSDDRDADAAARAGEAIDGGGTTSSEAAEGVAATPSASADDADGGYVHDPDRSTADAADASARRPVATPTATEKPDPEGFGRAGWLLVTAVVGCFVVIPGIIYLYPYVLGSFGLTFFGTYLVLPLIPAVLLGLVAVWSMSAAA